jgi:hypothetical protein
MRSPCGGGLEYFHRSPCESLEATKRKHSLRWDGKVWLLVLSDLTNQRLHCKLQTRPLVREGALGTTTKLLSDEKRRERYHLVMHPKGRPDTKTNWSTDRRPQDELQLQLSRRKKNWSRVPNGRLTPRQTADWLSVVMWLWLFKGIRFISQLRSVGDPVMSSQ